MSVLGNNILAGASGQGGYFIDRSLRFRSSASAYLSRTPASAGNRKTWTWSGWVKLGNLGTRRTLWSARNGTAGHSIEINDSNIIDIFKTNAGESFTLESTPVYRDVSAWYHFVFSVDTTQATASNRFKIYVNGSRVTSFSTETYPSQNSDLEWNNTIEHDIGRRSDNVFYFDGYLTEVNFIDGQALDPTYFGEYNADTGVWQPIKYTGTYGTNGFYLNFSDNSTTTTLGYDTSGNGNNWTANNISVTSGVTYDSMTDVPTLTSTDAANYATLNAVRPSTATLSDGNLKFTATTAAAWANRLSTIGMREGKWYCEFTIDLANSPFFIGIADENTLPNQYIGQSSGSWGYYGSGGTVWNNASSSALGASYTTGDLIGIAFNADSGTLTFYKNGVSQGTVSSIPIDEYFFAFSGTSVSTAGTANFGQRPFAYTPPAGFKSLNTYNLPDSTIEDGGEYFNTVLWTGNGSTQSITGVGFQPDFTWIKARNFTGNNLVFDVVRGKWTVGGIDVYRRLYTNSTSDETTLQSNDAITTFDADGFTVNSAGGGSNVNDTGDTYVGWSWKANGSGVSNTDGSITSTVSANTTAGFSIVTYTTLASTAGTVGHGLGVVPDMVIAKTRTASAAWNVWHKDILISQRLRLDDTSAATSSAVWNSTLPTADVFTQNISTTVQDAVAYCFTSIEGFSKFGSYTGNGSTDGTFVYTGFRPAFVMVKRTDSTGSWYIHDKLRAAEYNPQEEVLLAEASNAAQFFGDKDFVSNGFKIRDTASGHNTSGGTYIYMAFAENPFKNALAR